MEREPEPAPRPPDLALVIVESLRHDGLEQMPFLRGLGERYSSYALAVSPASWTLPSVASLLTGLPVHQHGVTTPESVLPVETLTLAEALGERGYTTALFGVNSWYGADRGLDQGFDVYRAWDGLSGGQLVEEVRTWLAGAPDEPVFVVVHVFDPHCPYRPPASQTVRPAGGGRVLTHAEWAQQGACFQVEDAHGAPELRVDAVKARYEAELRWTDDVLERLVGVLDHGRPGTGIAVVGDHGEAFWEHGTWGHGRTLHPEEIHVPAVWVSPERHELGVVEGPPHTSLMPVLHLAEAGGLEHLDEPAAISETSYDGPRRRAAWVQGGRVIDAPWGERADGDERWFEAARNALPGEAVAAEERPLSVASEQALRALGYVD